MSKWHTTDWPTTDPKWHGSEFPLYGGNSGKDLVGKQIGTVRVRKPLQHTRRSYECAAWWMKLETDTGEYPITLVKGYHSPHTLLACASIPATVTESYFPALWCGVSVSKGPYVDRDKGNRDTLGLQATLVDACLTSGHKGGDVECLVGLEYWEVAMLDQETRLRHAYESLPQWWGEWEAGEDQFHSRVRMVANVGGDIRQHGDALGELQRTFASWNKPGHSTNWCFSNH